MEIKKEPLAVKMEGTADNLYQPPKSSSTPGRKENAAPYNTPAAKTASKLAGAQNMTPPSTGCALMGFLIACQSSVVLFTE